MRLTEDFDREEFDCKDGTVVPSELMLNVTVLAENLQKLRDYLDRPVRVNSAYRTPTHNENVGGVDGSYHTYAMAADISAQDTTPEEVYCAIKHLIARGGTDGMQDGGLGYYGPDGHIHYDIGNVRRWTKPVGLAVPVCPLPEEEDEVTQEELDKLNARLDEVEGFNEGLVVLLRQLKEKREKEQAFHDRIGALMGGIYTGHNMHSEIIVNHEGRIVKQDEELDEVQALLEEEE